MLQTFLSIPQSIPATVYPQMAGVQLVYGGAVWRKYGIMYRCKRLISIVC